MNHSTPLFESIRLPKAASLWLALLSLIFFAYTYRSRDTAYILGVLLLFIWLLTSRPKNTPQLPHSLLIISKFYVLMLSVNMAWAFWQGEHSLYSTIEGYLHYYEFLLFIPLSVAMYHVKQHVLLLLLVPVAAVVLRVISFTDFSSLDTTLFSSSLYGFGRYHTTFGLQDMQVLLTLLCIAPLIVSQSKTTVSKLTWVIVLTAAAILLTQALVTAGSRAGWGGLLLGLFTLILIKLSGVKLNWPSWRGTIITLLAGCSIGYFVLANSDKIERRLFTDTQVNFELTLSKDKLPIEEDVFFARRVHLTYFGFELAQERPLLGHSPAGVSTRLESHQYFNIHPHLHNTYVQLLAELGTIGLMTFMTLICTFVALLWRKRRAISSNCRVIRLMLIVNTTSLAIWSIQASHLHKVDWRFTVVWYLSYAAFLLRMTRNEAPRITSAHTAPD